MAVFNGDLPTMSAANYQNSTYGGGQLLGNAMGLSNQLAQQNFYNQTDDDKEMRVLSQLIAATDSRRVTIKGTPKEKPAMPARRIVQVYIADPSEDVPLADAVLYTGKQQMTDLTDQELFFEIDIRDLLEGHNVKRAGIVNKKVKERTEYLEPVKVRDLKMVVVTVASF